MFNVTFSVENNNGTRCAHSGTTYARPNLPTGFLTLDVSKGYTFGSFGRHFCPWVIEAKPGQRIKLYLYDFTTQKSDKKPKYCPKAIYIREMRRPFGETEICKEYGARRKHVYTSKSHEISITVPRGSVYKQSFSMIEYEGMLFSNTVFVLLNAHCAKVMIGCAFIYRQQKHMSFISKG